MEIIMTVGTMLLLMMNVHPKSNLYATPKTNNGKLHFPKPLLNLQVVLYSKTTNSLSKISTFYKSNIG